eukprot:352178-Chlamydomonas_euryale.AAC.6
MWRGRRMYAWQGVVMLPACCQQLDDTHARKRMSWSLARKFNSRLHASVLGAPLKCAATTVEPHPAMPAKAFLWVFL